MALLTHPGDDPRAILRGLRAALHGGGTLALGDVPEGIAPPSDTAAIVTTSGSMGQPKRVILSRSALTASALATLDRVGEGAWLLALPAVYIAGLQVLVRALVAGREPGILAGSFSARSFAAAARSLVSYEQGHRVPTYTSLVPAQLATLVTAAEAGDRDVATALAGFQAILVGGQALPPALADRAAALGTRIVRTYGSSETAGGCVYDGAPLHDVAVDVVGGEILLSGPMLATGYLGDDALTADRFVHDDAGRRWYRTGDAGTLADGILAVRGRLDNVIISGGINVSLDRVERLVQAVPGLESAVVVGIPDARWGEASVVVLPRSAAGAHDEASLLAEARARVAAEAGRPARPAALTVIDAIPLLTSGKPDRAALRRLLAP